MREYVPVFFDWSEVTEDLTAEQKGNLIDAVVDYASGRRLLEDILDNLSSMERVAFRFLKGQVDRNAAISDARSRSASKKEQNETSENKREQNETNENKRKQNTTNSVKEKENNKEKDKENDKDNNKRFTPPTIEEVKAYCDERKNGIDPEYFIDYQTARNWILSNGKQAKDWRAVIRTWEKNNFNRTRGTPTKTVIAQQYDQRDYSEVQNEIQDDLAAEMELFLRG